MTKADILGVQVDSLSMWETAVKIQRAVEADQIIRVVTANPEMIFMAGKDPELKKIINTADIVTPDGIGVVWAAGKAGFEIRERVTGIDLLQAVFPLAHERKWKIFFLGGKPQVGDLAIARLSKQYPGIVWGTAHGYFKESEEADLLDRIKSFKPDLLCVGMGVPRQELWINKYYGIAKASIGVGGSFDVFAGLTERAPQWIRNIRLEWLYRLIREPGRWRRQAILPMFVFKVLAASYKSKKGL